MFRLEKSSDILFLTESLSCASQHLRQRNTSEQTEHVKKILKIATVERKLLMKQLN